MSDNHFWEIPSSVDLEGFLEKYPPKFSYKIDCFYYIIDYLSKGMDMEDLDSNEGFINMSSKKLQSVIHNYRQYLGHLLDHGFIRTDMKYIVGEKSFGYLIDKYSYHKALVKKVPLADLVIKKKKTIEAQDFNQKQKETVKHYPYLTKWFNKNLQINVEKAMERVEVLFPEQKGGIKGVKKGSPSDWAKRYKATYSIHKFANQDFYYSVDKNVGRFHSNFTNIKSELRNYITYDGQKLVNIDIKNSQPLFSTLLLKEDFYNQKSQYLNIYNITSSFKLLSNNKQSYNSIIIMLVKCLVKYDKQAVEQYLGYVNSGEFYKKISDLIYPGKVFDKKYIKGLIFTVFFSNNKFIGQPGGEPKKDFRTKFPEVYNVFRLIKKNNHRALSHILQRIESELIIKNVAKRISKERPDLPIFTIHDSVATTLGNEGYVSLVIKEEALKLTGLNVLLGKEYWDY